MRSRFSLLLLLLIPLLLAGLGVGGYFTYQRLQAQHAINQQELERFGYDMVAQSRNVESVGELGTKQLPATFDEQELTPTQKVIKSLLRDKEALLKENDQLELHITELTRQIKDLQEYKKLNEHFAPKRLNEELKQVERQLRAFLIRNPDAERFSTMEIEIMSAAAASEYKAYITRNRLMLSEDRKQKVISDYLPAYAFCVGDAVGLAANSAAEERQLARFFRTDDGSALDEALSQDLSILLTPCQMSVRERLENDKA